MTPRPTSTSSNATIVPLSELGSGRRALVVAGAFAAGGARARFRPRRIADGLVVPLQLQVIEADHLDHGKTTVLANGHQVKAGVEFDRIDRRVAYHLFRSHPGDKGFAMLAGSATPVRVRQSFPRPPKKTVETLEILFRVRVTRGDTSALGAHFGHHRARHRFRRDLAERIEQEERVRSGQDALRAGYQQSSQRVESLAGDSRTAGRERDQIRERSCVRLLCGVSGQFGSPARRFGRCGARPRVPG